MVITSSSAASTSRMHSNFPSFSVFWFLSFPERTSSVCSRTWPTWSWHVWNAALECQWGERGRTVVDGRGTTKTRSQRVRTATLSTCTWPLWTTPSAPSCRGQSDVPQGSVQRPAAREQDLLLSFQTFNLKHRLWNMCTYLSSVGYFLLLVSIWKQWSPLTFLCVRLCSLCTR